MKTTAREKLDLLCKAQDKVNVDKGKPEYGKQYRLTGVKGTPCISNENTWKESEVEK